MRYVLIAESVELVGRSIGESHASFATDSLSEQISSPILCIHSHQFAQTPVQAFWGVALTLGVGWGVASRGLFVSAVTDATVAA